MIEPMIDQNLAFEITNGSEELFKQMMDLFIQFSPDQLKKLEKALYEGDIDALVAGAHDIKSSASSLGALVLYESALKLEQAAKLSLELEQISPMIIDVEDKIMRTIAYYRDGHLSFESGRI